MEISIHFPPRSKRVRVFTNTKKKKLCCKTRKKQTNKENKGEPQNHNTFQRQITKRIMWIGLIVLHDNGMDFKHFD